MPAAITNDPFLVRTAGWVVLLFCMLAASQSYAQPAGLKDSMEVYNNAKAVQAFYEKSGRYKKTNETRLLTNDPAKIHAGNDRKYAEVLRTINNDRLTSQGKRKIRPEEYRVTIDKYKYKQRELSDYVLNMDAPMQLFDRRISPQVLVDYTYTSGPGDPINDDDVDFKMYDPIAVKPYSKLTAAEKAERNTKYPQPAKAMVKTAPKEPAASNKKSPVKPAENHAKSEFIISGAVPDSVRYKKFETRNEAEKFMRTLQRTSESD